MAGAVVATAAKAVPADAPACGGGEHSKRKPPAPEEAGSAALPLPKRTRGAVGAASAVNRAALAVDPPAAPIQDASGGSSTCTPCTPASSDCSASVRTRGRRAQEPAADAEAHSVEACAAAAARAAEEARVNAAACAAEVARAVMAARAAAEARAAAAARAAEEARVAEVARAAEVACAAEVTRAAMAASAAGEACAAAEARAAEAARAAEETHAGEQARAGEQAPRGMTLGSEVVDLLIQKAGDASTLRVLLAVLKACP